jgi:CheY-like chemotaxis protein
MVVEDEPITAQDIHEILCQCGYAVTAIVASGQQALEEAERSIPDLVLMDINLEGEMNGIETARALRERFTIPVIYLVAHSDNGLADEADLTDPVGYIVKPFEELAFKIAVLIGLQSAAARVSGIHVTTA